MAENNLVHFMNYEPGSIDFSVMNNQEKVFISKIIVKSFRIFLKFFFYNYCNEGVYW